MLTVSTGENFFNKVPASGGLKGGDVPCVNDIDAAGVTASSALDVWVKEEVIYNDVYADRNSMPMLWRLKTKMQMK